MKQQCQHVYEEKGKGIGKDQHAEYSCIASGRGVASRQTMSVAIRQGVAITTVLGLDCCVAIAKRGDCWYFVSQIYKRKLHLANPQNCQTFSAGQPLDDSLPVKRCCQSLTTSDSTPTKASKMRRKGYLRRKTSAEAEKVLPPFSALPCANGL